jgi:transposase-like protein
MKIEDIQALAAEAAKNIKSEKDLNQFKKMLTKMTLETALNAGLYEHLGYDRHDKVNTGNSRNGYSSKTLQTEDGPIKGVAHKSFHVNKPINIGV